MDRRTFLALSGLVLSTFVRNGEAKEFQGMEGWFKALESHTGGRLGVYCMDTESARVSGYRADERFPMCSTFKWLAVAALLKRVDAAAEHLERRIHFTRSDLTDGSLVTQHHVDGEGMTLAQLCEAAICESDNTAANLILRQIGGSSKWNQYVHSLDDLQTQLDRDEPTLNEGTPGDARDTTTPAAMAADLRRVLLEDALSAASRQQLTQWMLATKTSAKRLRADLPEAWRLADKTGTGPSHTGTANDVGIYWTPKGKPIVIAVYLTQARVPREQQEAAIAQIGRHVREAH